MDQDVQAIKNELAQWRQLLHQNPQTSYEETFISEFVQKKLHEFGLETHTGLAKTGVVGVLKGKGKGKKVGFRADMDALNITEENTFAYASKNIGKMHACGHDGHTSMLLGAAKVLSQRRNLAGDLIFIFQPAEEGGAGGDRMIKEGLFEKFPVESVWGMHNTPGLPIGQIAVTAGPMLGSADEFNLLIHGKGGHAAMPQVSTDPILIAAHIITALQSVVSRNLKPTDAGVISITMLSAGSAYNIIPQSVILRGTFRTLDGKVRELIIEQIKRVSTGIASAFGGEIELQLMPNNYPVTVNPAHETEIAVKVAEKRLGKAAVNRHMLPVLGAEDFAFMLQQKPGCYIFIGNGADGGKGSAGLHTPQYDFNDEGAPFGVQYWIDLAHTLLAV